MDARPQPNMTPWAHWAFVPGRMAEVVFVHARSKQLLLTALPVAPGQPRRVMLAREMAQPSPISALALDALGEWVGVGQEDGTVSFFVLGSVLGETACHGDEALASAHVGAHRGAVTGVTLLRGSMVEHGVETALGATASDDQRILTWDLRAGLPLHTLLTANTSPTTSLSLSLLPPGAAANGELREPSVLLLAGSADGGVQAWSLEAAASPRLLALWVHATRSPLLAVRYVPGDAADEARVMAVATGGHGAGAAARRRRRRDLRGRGALVRRLAPPRPPLPRRAPPRQRAARLCRVRGHARGAPRRRARGGRAAAVGPAVAVRHPRPRRGRRRRRRRRIRRAGGGGGRRGRSRRARRRGTATAAPTTMTRIPRRRCSRARARCQATLRSWRTRAQPQCEPPSAAASSAAADDATGAGTKAVVVEEDDDEAPRARVPVATSRHGVADDGAPPAAVPVPAAAGGARAPAGARADARCSQV